MGNSNSSTDDETANSKENKVLAVQVVRNDKHFGVRAILSPHESWVVHMLGDGKTYVDRWDDSENSEWKMLLDAVEATRIVTVEHLKRAGGVEKYDVRTNNCIHAVKRMMLLAVPDYDCRVLDGLQLACQCVVETVGVARSSGSGSTALLPSSSSSTQ